MKKTLKNIFAIFLCFIMMISMCMPSFAIDVKTEQYMKKFAVAGIKKATGMIPVVGGTISNIIGNFLPGMLGITSDHAEVMAKLNEIYNAIINLDLKLDKQQQELFQEFYQQKISGFNDDANKLKGTIDRLYTRLTEIEGEYEGKNEDEKQVSIARLILSNNFDDPTSAMAQLTNLTDYICGTQISNASEDGIYQLVFKANCKDSLLGCEAAMKSAQYVNSLSQYMESAYKTLFAISAAKIYVCENYDRIAAEMADGTIAKCDISGYTQYDKANIMSAVFGSNKSSLLEYYNMLFDENRSDSAISLYNNMLENVWFSYIEGTDYTQKPAKIDYIHLNSEIAFVSPYDIGYDESLGKKEIGSARVYSEQIKKNFNSVDKEMITRVHSALTPDQINRLMKHLSNNSMFGTDTSERSIIAVLEDIGFSFDAYNSFIDSIPKDPYMSGVIYRDPTKPKAETDGKVKIFPLSTQIIYGSFYIDIKNGVTEVYPDVPSGWIGDYVIGYRPEESVNNAVDSNTALLARVCYGTTLDKKGKDGEFANDPSVFLMYFTDAENSSLNASIFSKMSSFTIPLICIGAAAIIAVPTVIIIRRKRKNKKNKE